MHAENFSIETHSLIGLDPSMDLLRQQISSVARSDAAVLLIGESGTGKEVVARAIHAASTRAHRPFVAINCAAISPHLIEASLFGHERGSFTGASRQQVGFFEHASGGTLFLDEVTEMQFDMQVKLLRVLESGHFHRVGGDCDVHVDVRVIAATNRSLDAALENNKLREDLMYRLAVFPIHIPPLRERGQDIVLLARQFLRKLNDAAQTEKTFSKTSYDAMQHYAWPGNVRELKNIIQRAFILASTIVHVDELLANAAQPSLPIQNGFLNFPVGMPLADVQRDLILATLHHYSGNKRLTSQALGISLKTLYNRLKAY